MSFFLPEEGSLDVSQVNQVQDEVFLPFHLQELRAQGLWREQILPLQRRQVLVADGVRKLFFTDSGLKLNLFRKNETNETKLAQSSCSLSLCVCVARAWTLP